MMSQTFGPIGQIDQINFGVFGVFSDKLSASIFALLIPCPYSVSYSKQKPLRKILKTVSKWMSLYKWPLYQLFWPFLALCMFIFHKTEVLTVILRCLTGLTYDWLKSYDTKGKYFHFFFFVILYKNRHLLLLCFLCFCVFCHNLCTNSDLDSLSTSKWLSESQFCER